MTQTQSLPTESQPPSGLQVHVTDDEDRANVAVAGELDLRTCRMLLEHVATFAMHKPVVAVDLSGVSFMDSTGVRALWELRQRCASAKKRLTIEQPSAAVTKVLRATGLDRTFAAPD
jgi:anti-sigma B factor antagonist